MMAAGLEHSLALTESGDLYSFGDNLRYGVVRYSTVRYGTVFSGTTLLHCSADVMLMSDESPKLFPKRDR